MPRRTTCNRHEDDRRLEPGAGPIEVVADYERSGLIGIGVDEWAAGAGAQIDLVQVQVAIGERIVPGCGWGNRISGQRNVRLPTIR
jgi:hypothetical protein